MINADMQISKRFFGFFISAKIRLLWNKTIDVEI